MPKPLKLVAAILFAAALSSCGDKGCLCSDGSEGGDIAVPSISGRPCDLITPPAGYNYCYDAGSDHVVDPWGLGPQLTLDVPQPWFVVASR